MIINLKQSILKQNPQADMGIVEAKQYLSLL